MRNHEEKGINKTYRQSSEIRQKRIFRCIGIKKCKEQTPANPETEVSPYPVLPLIRKYERMLFHDYTYKITSRYSDNPEENP